MAVVEPLDSKQTSAKQEIRSISVSAYLLDGLTIASPYVRMAACADGGEDLKSLPNLTLENE